MKKTVTLIIHGHRKLSDKTREAIDLMSNESIFVVKKQLTKGPGDAAEIARHANTNSNFIIAVGGDGTCNEIINGLMIEPNPEIIFGVIPNGTGNDFTRNFPDFDPYAFVTAMVEESVKHIDIGKIDFAKESRYFLNVADIGFGAKVIETLNQQRASGIRGRFSYNLAIIRSFFTFRKPILNVQTKDFQHEGKVMMVIFSNGTSFGSGLQIYPDAQLDNGKLGLTIIGEISIIEYARHLGKLKHGKKIVHPKVTYQEFERVRVTTTDQNLCVETDGEIAGRSSITVRVIPGAIKIIC